MVHSETAQLPMNLEQHYFPKMKSLILASGLVASLSLLTHTAIAQPAISGVFPNGSYQFQSTNVLAFTASSSAGIANVSVTLTATTLFGVQGFPQTLTSSGGLTISGSADNESVSAPLKTNMLYTATIVATDTGSLSTTQTVTFDTISPAYTWEARDWDYTSNGVSGLFIDNPQTNAYAGLVSTIQTDYYNGNTNQGSASYRPQGLETEPCGDTARLAYSPYTTNSDYDVGYNNGGNWGNYTRHYRPGVYNVFVRASDGNGNPQTDAGEISVVAGTASFANNGAYTFSVKPTGWQTYEWYPLLDSSNNPAVLTIPNDGTASTLQMKIDNGSCNENFFMLLPINTNAPIGGAGYVASYFPDGTYQFQETNTFDCAVMSTNGIMSVVAEVTGNYLTGGSFQQTLTSSSGLTITGSGTDENVSFALSTNAMYSVTLLITDGAGNASSTNLVFDTVYPGYYTWEAEDWDYNGGQYIDNPQTNAYAGLFADYEIDSVCPGGPTGNGGPNDYGRGSKSDTTTAMSTEPSGDVARGPYINTGFEDYAIGYTAGGQWGNYTRHYPSGIYNIYVRLADGGNATSDSGTFSLVTGGYGTTSQTYSQIGTFSAPATGGWNTYKWAPVLNAAGYPARFMGSNDLPQTLHMALVSANCNLNYYMLVPANLNNNPPPFVDDFTPDSSVMFQPSNEVTFTANSSVGIATTNIVLYLNGIKQSNLSFSGSALVMNVTCPIQTNQFYTAIITLSDAAGHTAYTNTFATYSASSYQWEAEDYDYTANGTPGQYVDNPQTNAYLNLGSTAGIDNYQSDLSANRSFSYRPNNDPGAAPATGTAGDGTRAQFSLGGTDYNIGFFGSGSWVNFTRHYPAGVYNVIGRFAEGASPTHAVLSILTSGYGTANQTSNFLGTFNVSLSGWSSWEWAPLVDNGGNLVQVTLNGSQQTLKLGGSASQNDPEVNVNFLMLVPANTNVPSITGVYPNGTNMMQYATALTFAVNSSIGVSTNSIIVTVDGVVVTNLVFTATASGWNVSYPGLQPNTSHTVNIQVTDANGNVATSSVTFNDYNPTDYQWEAEDYDYTANGVSGQYFDNPQTNAYANLGGAANLDLLESDPGAFSRGYTYRANNGVDFPDTTSGDSPRAQFTAAGKTDYSIGSFGNGSFANYTRHYPLGTYNILGRFAEGATGGSSVIFAKVTSGYGTTNQTAAELGTFNIPTAGWSSWEFVEMTNGGSPASVTFDGSQTTLKLEGANNNEANINFFMLVPTTPEPPITPTVSAGKVNLSFVIQSGYTYELQYKTHLTDPSWTQVPGSEPMTGNMVTNVTDTIGSNGTRFYRLLIQSTP